MTLLRLAPDKFQRYQQASHIIRSFEEYTKHSILLDLGASENILSNFFPEANIIQVDISHIHPINNFICANALYLPFRNKSVDFITVLDVIEHLPESQRDLLIKEVARVVKIAAVFSFPISTPDNIFAEQLIFDLEKNILNTENMFLKEHIKNKLPTRKTFLSYARLYFPYIQSYPNFNHELWFISKIIDIVFSILPNSDALKSSIYCLFNHALYLKNMNSPLYRETFVCSQFTCPDIRFEEELDFNKDEILHSLVNNINEIFKKLNALHNYSKTLELKYQDQKETIRSFEKKIQGLQVKLSKISESADQSKKAYFNLEKAYLGLLEKNLTQSRDLKHIKDDNKRLMLKMNNLHETISQLKSELNAQSLKIKNYCSKFNELQNNFLLNIQNCFQSGPDQDTDK